MLPPSRAPRQPGIGRMRQARRGFAAIAAVAVGEEAGRAEEAPSGRRSSPTSLSDALADALSLLGLT